MQTEVDEFLPAPETVQERSAQRTRLMRKVFRVLKEDLARYENQDKNTNFDQVFEEINDG